MNKSEAILISAYTGYLLTKNFSDVHSFCEKLLNRPIFTHEFAQAKTQKEIQEKCKPLIIDLIKNEVWSDKMCEEKAAKVQSEKYIKSLRRFVDISIIWVHNVNDW